MATVKTPRKVNVSNNESSNIIKTGRVVTPTANFRTGEVMTNKRFYTPLENTQDNTK